MPSSDDASAMAVAVAVSGNNSSSRRAVRWAVQNLMPHATRFTLLHVTPPINKIPNPAGEHIPIEGLDEDVVALYKQEIIKSKSEKIFVPLKRLCRTRNMETIVLDDDNPATSLLRYISDSDTTSLVLGSSSSNCIMRKLKGPDVPSTILKMPAITCNIFVVSQNKVIKKLANDSVLDGSSFTFRRHLLEKGGETTSERVFTHREDGLNKQILGSQSACVESTGNKTLEETIQADFSLFSQACEDDSSTISREKSEIASVLTSFRDTPSIFLPSTEQSEAHAEIERLRLELQNALAMYRGSCEDLIHARNKVHLLSAKCSEEVRKVREAQEREEILQKIAAEERAKNLEARKEVNVARELLAKEAHERQKAEMNAVIESSERMKVADALFSYDGRYKRYSRDEIEVATECFSEAKKIGEGGYGKVYKCSLDHTPVAVKVLRQDATDKKEEFLREVEVLSQIRHPHMVLLLGACPESGCLVYEYMENGSLQDRLFCDEGTQPLPWFIRFRIIFEVACGLAFLHGSKPDPIIHRDLKPGNILLDGNNVSKIGDVGLAKLVPNVVPDSVTEYRDTVLAGTLYYMDPEYQRTGTLRPKSDLYAFGIIALQLLTAMRPMGLSMTVENAINGGSFADILDKSIKDWPLAESEKLARIALKCSALRCRDRPDLESEVMPELEEIRYMADTRVKLQQCNIYAPSHYYCPILQEVMSDPYIAADGYTYEYRAIKAWLGRQRLSPLTKLPFSHTSIIPNYTLRSAIQNWKRHATSSNNCEGKDKS